VLPALGAVYLLAAHRPLGRRIGHLLVGFAAMIVSAGWWVAVVELWPASSRPYIGGSQHNSILELTFGYNGFGRITGSETGSVGGFGQVGGRWGSTGILRLFGTEIGGQFAWLLPAALILLGAGLWFTRRAPRTDLARAGLVVWGLWLLVTGLTFSFMAGIFHPYYTVALAPAVAALVGIGTTLLWRRRQDSPTAGPLLAGTVLVTAAVAFVLLQRTPDYLPWLKWLVVLLGLASAVALAGVRLLPRRAAIAVAAAALITTLAAPAAYSVTTAATPHTGSIPSAGPAVTGGPGGMGGPGGLAGRPAPGGMVHRGFPGTPPQQGQALGQPAQGMSQPPGVAGNGAGNGTGARTGAGASAGGLLEGSTSSAALSKLLETDAYSYTWVAAAVGSNTAAGYQLATQQPVMAIGGFNGSDPSPTLAQFKKYVADGEIHYFIAGGGLGGFGGGPGGAPGGGSTSSTSSAITSWVQQNFTAKTVGGVTVYDLSSGVR
jgi:4-amino-4-deoxy-L-arabinose transferase-like glycosyltransferase